MVTIHIVDAFTDTPETGNRAGVVLDAGGLNATEMQDIAAFAGFSETAFVLPAQGPDHDLQVRYFTPQIEVPICGHATIATHFLRASVSGDASYPLNVLTGAGILPVEVSKDDEELRVSMTQGAVEYGQFLNTEELDLLAAALGLEQSDFADGLPAQIVSTGHSKVIIPIQSRDVLDGLEPDAEKLTLLSNKIGCNGFFPVVLDKSGGALETYGRMFAPAIGIAEDPVTGNANGPTGAYLVKHGVIKLTGSFSYQGHQGHKMGKRGTVFVTLSLDGENLKVQVAGQAVRAGELEYPA
ncbi:PhzF family phenazine biosynthesis isomerase [Parasedimentitalea huanghaiensis]|uniref:PhzF family phenazine biosynthesis isomerase n=1 Tax=Parasedimentitalea huanghaiensis TaxID=2682100 RepID=A0A6L6WBS5_9RHOB|nr:PhzF family phenazine biosynthesis isomerase [Zongyanglinia huanghaiensis]MVO15283.1 PhzF family phenazine biosynthesis isomerase [Zongyanglinia huanghaiensis]